MAAVNPDNRRMGTVPRSRLMDHAARQLFEGSDDWLLYLDRRFSAFYSKVALSLGPRRKIPTTSKRRRDEVHKKSYNLKPVIELVTFFDALPIAAAF